MPSIFFFKTEGIGEKTRPERATSSSELVRLHLLSNLHGSIFTAKQNDWFLLALCFLFEYIVLCGHILSIY